MTLIPLHMRSNSLTVIQGTLYDPSQSSPTSSHTVCSWLIEQHGSSSVLSSFPAQRGGRCLTSTSVPTPWLLFLSKLSCFKLQVKWHCPTLSKKVPYCFAHTPQSYILKVIHFRRIERHRENNRVRDAPIAQFPSHMLTMAGFWLNESENQRLKLGLPHGQKKEVSYLNHYYFFPESALVGSWS